MLNGAVFLVNRNINKLLSLPVIVLAMSHDLVPFVINPPESVRGMTELDRSQFSVNLKVPCLNLNHAKLSDVMRHVKKYGLKVPCLKFIQVDPDNETKLLLNPGLVKKWDDIDSDDRRALNGLSVSESDFGETSVTMTYDNFQANDIFKAVLPREQDGFSSFSKVGHMVHLNLREHLFAYKNLIAQVLYDKVPNTRTVVNKLDAIDNTYRNFQMEVLAGDNDMMVKVCENKCTYEFDFSKVYWNPRLSTEHERIIGIVKPGDVLIDVFAGVGPFSIPAAKKKCHVFANDLNPESYKWLNHNVKLNKINLDYIQTFNKDGREFIQTDVKDILSKYINTHNVHIVMNLPALASEFLNAFEGLYEDLEVTKPAIVYLYCFAKGEKPIEITKNLIVTNFGRDIGDKIIDIFRVRTVSNFKEMMRVTIKLDADILVACSNKRKGENVAKDPKKR